MLWLLEELGIEYEIKYYERDAQTMLAPPSLRQVHPLGKSPVITDGDITLALVRRPVTSELSTFAPTQYRATDER